MKIAQIWEWDMPKDRDRLKALEDWSSKTQAYLAEVNEKYNRTRTSWSQGDNHMILIIEFADADDYAKFMKDDEAQMWVFDFCRTVDNVTVRTCRPAISRPE